MSIISRTLRYAVAQPLTEINLFSHTLNLDKFGWRFSKSNSGCPGSSGERNPPYSLGPSSGDSNNPGAPTMYDSRKLGHKLSSNNVCPNFETLKHIPTGVFRNTTGEVLGRDAGKCFYYKNPEYFSFHHMSFYDFNLSLRKNRRLCPKTGRKPM